MANTPGGSGAPVSDGSTPSFGVNALQTAEALCVLPRGSDTQGTRLAPVRCAGGDTFSEYPVLRAASQPLPLRALPSGVGVQTMN